MRRNYYLDNFKAILIVLVVLTHFLGALSGREGVIKSFTIFTNLFYMPAFIMISGFFSKKNKLVNLVKTILIPYFVFQMLNLLLNALILQKEIQFSLLMPQFTLWYLLSLFFWRIGLETFLKLKYPVLILIVLSLVIGLDSNVGIFLSISRTFYYFPFFVLGYKIDLEKLLALKTKTNKSISVIALVFVIIIIFKTCSNFSEVYFRGAMSYAALGQSNVMGILFRIFCYLIGGGISLSVALLIPKKKMIFSYIGERTMSIYMWHGLIYQFVKNGTIIYSSINTTNEIIIWVILVMLLILVLSSKPVVKLTSIVSKIPIEHLMKESREIENEKRAEN